jgi:hypothetical protein
MPLLTDSLDARAISWQVLAHAAPEPYLIYRTDSGLNRWSREEMGAVWQWWEGDQDGGRTA